MSRVLIIDDDFSLRELMEMIIRNNGHQTELAYDGVDGLAKALSNNYDLIVSDIRMPGLSGIEVLTALRKDNITTPLILISAYASTDTAVEAMRMGAYDFIPKPFKPQDLLAVVDSALAHQDVERERQALAEMVETNQRFGHLVGAAPAMIQIYDLIKRSAQTDTSILITGESGTGKELVAKSVHENSNRAEGPFVAINCGGMPEQLVESELFGYKKGAFTGANTDKKGLVTMAEGGTLFLDELGELTLATQVKLLRLIQEKTYRPVGATSELKADVRFVAATNRNLENEIIAGNFREDLYYRLNVINIRLPSLRERAADIPLLAHFFLEKYSKEQNKDVRKLSAYALDILSKYHFPGNVRELENIIERSVALEQSSIILPESLKLADFKRDFQAGALNPGGLPNMGNPHTPPFMPPNFNNNSTNNGFFQKSGASPFQAEAFENVDPKNQKTYARLEMPIMPTPGLLDGLPEGGIDSLLTSLEGYYLYNSLICTNGARGRSATMLSISPWRLRMRLVAYDLADANIRDLIKLPPERFAKPILHDNLAPNWANEELNLDDVMKQVEREYIRRALVASGENKTEAASFLGLSRRSLQHRLEKTNYEEWIEEFNKTNK